MKVKRTKIGFKQKFYFIPSEVFVTATHMMITFLHLLDAKSEVILSDHIFASPSPLCCS